MFNIPNIIPHKIHTWQKYQNTFLFLLFFRRKRINVQLIRSTHPHNKCTIHYSFLFWLLLFSCSFFSITIIPSHWRDKVYSRCCCVPLWTPLRKVHTQYAAPPRRPHSRCCPRRCTALQRLPPFSYFICHIYIHFSNITNCNFEHYHI